VDSTAEFIKRSRQW